MSGRTLRGHVPGRHHRSHRATAPCGSSDLHGGRLRGVSFDLRRGEILGVGGLAGQGQRDLFLTLFGAQRAAAGTVSVGGEAVTIRRPKDAIRAGRRHRLRARGPQGRGAVPAAVHPRQHRAGHPVAPVGRRVRPAAAPSGPQSRRSWTSCGIGAGRSTNQAVGTLSGGNQQKVVMARWLLTDARCCCCSTSPAASTRPPSTTSTSWSADARRAGQGDPLLLQRDRGDREPLPPRPGAARGPDRGRARRSGRRCRADRRRVHEGGRRCVRSLRPGPCGRRLALSQGGLGYVVLAATAVAYFVVYTSNLGRLPTSFDYLSILNTTLPLVFVAIGQSLVVLTGGIDLSVGGIVSLCVAVTATTVTGAGLDPFGWIAASCWRWARPAARSTASSWPRPHRADPHHPGHAVHLHRPRAAGAAGAGRLDPARGAARAHQPERADRADLAGAGGRRLARVAPHPVRDAGVRRRQRREQRPRRRRARGPGEGRRLRAVGPVQRAGRGVLRVHDHGRRRQRRRPVHPHLHRLGGRRRRRLQRRSGQRARRDGRRGRADSRHRRAVLRRHRPALPVAVPGPVPGRRRPARHRRRPDRPPPEGPAHEFAGRVQACEQRWHAQLTPSTPAGALRLRRRAVARPRRSARSSTRASPRGRACG